jgi:hypothetical protein
VRTKMLVPAVAFVLAVTVSLSACGGHSKSGQSLENQQQTQDTTSLVTNQPVPHYNFSQIRQNLIELENAEAQGVQTTTFFFNQGVADPIGECPSIGAPIPTTDQLTNPQQVQQHSDAGGGNVTIGQMDPDGVYSGDSTGTYVMCVGADGKPYADYWEGFVQTVFGAAKWDPASRSVQMIGAPSYTFTKGH